MLTFAQQQQYNKQNSLSLLSVRVSCPHCHAFYLVKAGDLPEPTPKNDGRSGWPMVCSGCHHEWFFSVAQSEPFQNMTDVSKLVSSNRVVPIVHRQPRADAERVEPVLSTSRLYIDEQNDTPPNLEDSQRGKSAIKIALIIWLVLIAVLIYGYFFWFAGRNLLPPIPR